ncbi:MAG: hypothetical protein ACREUQ_14160, partial [Burkholderiales bacterium]
MKIEKRNQFALENAADGAGVKPGAQGGANAAIKPLPEDAVIVIPVRNVVLFPGVILPVSMRRERSV